MAVAYDRRTALKLAAGSALLIASPKAIGAEPAKGKEATTTPVVVGPLRLGDLYSKCLGRLEDTWHAYPIPKKEIPKALNACSVFLLDHAVRVGRARRTWQESHPILVFGGSLMFSFNMTEGTRLTVTVQGGRLIDQRTYTLPAVPVRMVRPFIEIGLSVATKKGVELASGTGYGLEMRPVCYGMDGVERPPIGDVEH